MQLEFILQQDSNKKKCFNCVQTMENDNRSILLPNMNNNQFKTSFFKKADDNLSTLVLMMLLY